MTKHRDLNSGDVFPASWTDAIQELLGAYVSGNFKLEKANDTTLQIVSASIDDQVGIAIDGRWRYNTATVTAAHPGGAAAEFDVFVHAKDNSFSNSPTPDTDLTEYNFYLKILATGQTPSGTGTETLYRKIATCTWDGTKITKVTQLVGGVNQTLPAAQSFSVTIGNGSAKQFDVAHGLSTTDVYVMVREANSPFSVVLPEVRILDSNQVRLVFDVAPTANEFVVSILGGSTNTKRDVGVFTAVIGDAASTSYVVTHNLASRDLVVGVRENSGSYEQVDCGIEFTNNNQVTLRFVTAPAVDAYAVTIVSGANRVGAASQHGTAHGDGTDPTIPLVTSLPVSPADKTEVYYLADDAAGVIWHLRYRAASASAHKWEVIGSPPPLYSEVTASEQTDSTSTYVNLTTVGPSIALPLPGDYMVAIGCWSRVNVTDYLAYMSYAIGATVASDADAVSLDNGRINEGRPSMRKRRKNGLTAVTLTAKYRGGAVSSSVAQFANRWMEVIPVRVG